MRISTDSGEVAHRGNWLDCIRLIDPQHQVPYQSRRRQVEECVTQLRTIEIDCLVAGLMDEHDWQLSLGLSCFVSSGLSDHSTLSQPLHTLAWCILTTFLSIVYLIDPMDQCNVRLFHPFEPSIAVFEFFVSGVQFGE